MVKVNCIKGYIAKLTGFVNDIKKGEIKEAKI